MFRTMATKTRAKRRPRQAAKNESPWAHHTYLGGEMSTKLKKRLAITNSKIKG